MDIEEAVLSDWPVLSNSADVFFAGDHAGYSLKVHLMDHARSKGMAVHDLGAYDEKSVDYPLYAQKMAVFLAENPGACGVLICGSGIGISMVANRYPHIRAALCHDTASVELARKHNDANVLVLGGRYIEPPLAVLCLDVFLSTAFEGGRHQKRINLFPNSAYLLGLESLRQHDPAVHQAIMLEIERLDQHIELIASENITSLQVMMAQGMVMTNKYAEGYPNRRYYGGCEAVDQAEMLAIDRAKQLFECGYVNVQPHSGAQANQAVFLALMNPGDCFMGMDLSAGGHLTHGAKPNLSGKWFHPIGYGVHPETHRIDYDQVRDLAKQHHPKLIIAGGSAYPRIIDFKAFRSIADEVGALFMVDMAHFAGLVAAGVHPSPLPYADVVTTTTHKTLRGPRGGMILTQREDLAKKIDSAVFPGLQGGPLMHVIAAKAVALGEALRPEFKTYAEHVVKNAKILSETLKKGGCDIVSGGTDTHLMLVDLRPLGNVTGKQAESALQEVHMVCNKNAIPFDPQKPTITSGIRLGSPAATSRGFGADEFQSIGQWIIKALESLSKADEQKQKTFDQIRESVADLCRQFPVYPELLACAAPFVDKTTPK